MFSLCGLQKLAQVRWLHNSGNKKKHQEVVDYCMNDVRITKELILLFLEGKLEDPNTGDILNVVIES